MTRFCRFDLRTTDATAARAFYAKLLGHDGATIWPLHEQARARGAQPHWLGSIGVEDPERAAAAFVARGAVPIGPVRPTAYGGTAVVLRDPGGALVALATPPPPNAEAPRLVVWHVLNTTDVARATTNYRELFGWEFGERIELGAHGSFQQFAWQAGGANVGVFGDIVARPGVHAHWNFCFEVDALEPALAWTRAAGGVALEPIVLPSGERMGVCDDPQGATFALRERRQRV